MKKTGSILAIHYQEMDILSGCPAFLQFPGNISNYHLSNCTNELNYEKLGGRLEKANQIDPHFARNR